MTDETITYIFIEKTICCFLFFYIIILIIPILSYLILKWQTMASNKEEQVSRGRKAHNFYNELNFMYQKLENGRTAAQCTFCNAILKNTSISRLRTHRKRCLAYSASDDDDESESSLNLVFNDDDESDVDGEEAGKNIEVPTTTTPTPTELPLSDGVVEEIVLDYNSYDDNNEHFVMEALDQPFLIASNDEVMPSILKSSEDHTFDHNYANSDKNMHNGSKSNIKIANIFQMNEPSTSHSSLSTGTSRPSTSSSMYSTYSPASTPEINEKIVKLTPKKVNSAKKVKMSNSKKINSYIDTITANSKAEVDMALAKLFFGCNIPFSVVESDHFKNFIRTIRPAYVPPCRKTLSTTLLNKTNEEMMATNKQYMAKETSLLIDGWKNSSNNTKNVVTMLQSVGGKSMFLESYDFSNERETGESLETVCEKSISLAKERYNCEIYAVVSDNASNMLRMGRLTSLWHSTCSSHTGNLFAKDLINKELMAKLSTVLNEFKHTDLENSLVKNGGSRIVLPAETRWCSHRDSSSCFLKNLPIMRKIVAEGMKVKAEVTYLLYDDKFIEEITTTISLLDPICELINRCQSSNFSIADSTEEWLSISNSLPDSDKVHTALARRIEMGTNIYSLTANFLHPVYRGKKLNLDQLNCVQDFLLDTLNNEGLDGLHAFEQNSNMFQKLFEKKVTSPDTFWGLAEKKYPSLSNLAQKLMKIPASSAQLERIFSNWSFVHSTLRNRLTQDKSTKLIFVYYSLKLRDSYQSEDY